MAKRMTVLTIVALLGAWALAEEHAADPTPPAVPSDATVEAEPAEAVSAETSPAQAATADAGMADAARAEQETAAPTVSLESFTGPKFEGLTRARAIKMGLRASGVVVNQPIRPGQHVQAGELLAELDSAPEKANLQMNKLKAASDHQVRVADLTARQEEHKLERVRMLAAKNAATEWEVREAELAVDVAKVRIEYAQFQQQMLAEQVKIDEAILEQRRLVANVPGIIYRTFKEVGGTVQQLEPIVELHQLDPLSVELNVAEANFGAIRQGAPARVTCGAKQRVGTVTEVDPDIDAASRTFRVRLEVPNADGALAAGVDAIVQFAE